ncbi:MAG: hypothetical protein U9Q68_12260 [Euryarchaeota archaeon]|nr:hypothetical protein [Euryarchaeota archaeon]
MYCGGVEYFSYIANTDHNLCTYVAYYICRMDKKLVIDYLKLEDEKLLVADRRCVAGR